MPGDSQSVTPDAQEPAPDPIKAFAKDLSQWRATCGNPSLRDLETLSASCGRRVSKTAIGDAFAGKSKPRDWEDVWAVIQACALAKDQADLARKPDQADEKSPNVGPRSRIDAALWRKRYEDLEQGLAEGRKGQRRRAVAAKELREARRYKVAPVAGSAPPVPSHLASSQPGRLLAARSQVVPFVGRTAELAELSTWRDDPLLSGTSVMLVHGPGGQGKTRLVAEFARRSAEAGNWAVLVASQQPEPTGAAVQRSVGDARSEATGLMLVVDYAERWPTSDLLALVEDHLSSGRVRVLLAARPAGLWWDALSFRLTKTGEVQDTRTLKLACAAVGRAARAEMFTTARDRFATVLSVTATESIEPPPDLGGKRYASTLAVHMAALVAVDAHARGVDPPRNPAAHAGYLLDQERVNWGGCDSRDNAGHLRTPPRVVGRAVYLASLTGPVSHETGRAALKLARTTSGEHPDIDTILDDHTVCYPPADDATVLQPLEPDRLAEAYLAVTTPGHSYDRGSDPWATSELIERLLTGDSTTPPTWAAQAVTVLVETGLEAPHIATRVLNPILSRHPHLAISAGVATLTRLAEIPSIDLAVLEAIGQRLPDGHDINTDVAAAAISTRLITDRVRRAGDPPEKAAVHLRHAQRMYAIGRHQEALAAAQAAQRTYLEIPHGDLANYLADVINTSNLLSMILSDLGQREQALEISQWIVAVVGRVALIEPRIRPDYASTLSGHSCRLAECGRPDLGLQYAQTAVMILAGVRDPRHNATMAQALNNLSVRQHEMDMHAEALRTVKRAVYFLERLLDEDPARYLTAYSNAVTNLVVHYSWAGRADEAERQVQKVVDICRELAQTIPEKYLPGLAKALRNLAIDQTDRGKCNEAIERAEESIELYRELAATRPRAFQGDLALSLATYARACARATEKLPHALAAITEAIAHLDELTEKWPMIYADKLAEARYVRDTLHQQHTT